MTARKNETKGRVEDGLNCGCNQLLLRRIGLIIIEYVSLHNIYYITFIC
jgi:hypothetical protein